MILYADLEQSASFGAWFRFLWSLTASDRPARAGSAAKPRNLHPPARPFQPRLRFAIRWGGSSSSSTRRLVLSGYGAALDIKKSEYLAIDDRNSAATDMSNLPSNDSAQARSAMLPVKKQDVSSQFLERDRQEMVLTLCTLQLWPFVPRLPSSKRVTRSRLSFKSLQLSRSGRRTCPGKSPRFLMNWRQRCITFRRRRHCRLALDSTSTV